MPADEHIAPHRIGAPALTDSEQTHLDACLRCTLGRKDVLRAAASSDPIEGPAVPPGTRVGRWVIEGQLGRGGMGTVYRARHLDLDTPAAIKVVHAADADTRHRLRQEGKVQAQLRHPNVVHVIDVVEIDGAPGLVMELIDGPTLREFLRRGRPSIEQADHLARGIFAGVAAAHAAGWVHRDLKPENILLAQPGNGTLVPKIADFGLVKVSRNDGDSHVTRTGVAMGSTRYMAPEQFRESKSVDARADIFSLGAILYELATGWIAFDGTDKVRPVIEVAPDAPARMIEAIDRALRTDRDERPADVPALEALWFGSVDTIAPRPGLRQPESFADLRAVPTPVAPRVEPSKRRLLPWLGLVVPAVAVLIWWLQPPSCAPLPAPLMPLRVGNWWV